MWITRPELHNIPRIKITVYNVQCNIYSHTFDNDVISVHILVCTYYTLFFINAFGAHISYFLLFKKLVGCTQAILYYYFF